MTIEYRFIEPLDVLFLRGNKVFGDPGSYGECLVPPWPSVAAGAIRSRMLVDDGVDLPAFGRNQVDHPSLGTPADPGSFLLAGFYLARQQHGSTEVLLPPPADLVVSRYSDAAGALAVHSLRPLTLPAQLQCSFALERPPVLAQGAARSKPESGYWLTQDGWASYLLGNTPTAGQLVHASELWTYDPRVGIGMDAGTRSVEDGKLFTTQALVLHAGVGFVAAVQGAQAPAHGLLRLGGDGRAAAIAPVQVQLPAADYAQIAQAGRCRLVLTSPGLFPAGWALPGTQADGRISLPGGISARLVSAAVPRAETLSGWDLAKWQPKAAQRVAPAGSVYWLEELQASPEALGKLAQSGLWAEPCEDAARRAEGFNRCAIAAWSEEARV